ncbi:23S rRNA (guanosine(2251)-2'-O)-methyltransferase RlmB [Coriobacteriales bacterium OH1046]|nr:23S rRNA (guanosine(2251)-2'-O)-methyltransferase RlmB [Coriobacteriales bacterium OH1046]
MAKNQSRTPGRDVRGGNGKRAGKNKIVPRNLPDPEEHKKAWQQDRPRGNKPKKAQPKRGSDVPTGDIIEGRRAVAEAIELGLPLKSAFIADAETSDATLKRLTAELAERGAAIEHVTKARLDQMSSHGAHQGIMVRTRPFAYASLADIVRAAGSGDALVIVLDHVTDEGNFGAIARTAEVVGAAGIVIANARAARVGVGAYKTSAGAVLHLPIAQVSNLPRALDELKHAGFWVCGASEHAEQVIWDASVEGRLALVMGSENAGISQLMLEKCDFLAKLPQRGRIESLNVAQAAAVFCYEWQRRTSPDA